MLATLQIIQSGDKGLYQFSGIQTTVAKDGRKFKFVSAKMADGSEIDPKNTIQVLQMVSYWEEVMILKMSSTLYMHQEMLNN